MSAVEQKLSADTVMMLRSPRRRHEVAKVLAVVASTPWATLRGAACVLFPGRRRRRVEKAALDVMYAVATDDLSSAELRAEAEAWVRTQGAEL